jgi:hypothetical protein
MLFVFFVVKFLLSPRGAEAQREKTRKIWAAKRRKKHKNEGSTGKGEFSPRRSRSTRRKERGPMGRKEAQEAHERGEIPGKGTKGKKKKRIMIMKGGSVIRHLREKLQNSRTLESRHPEQPGFGSRDFQFQIFDSRTLEL